MTEKSEFKAQNLSAVQAFLMDTDLYLIDEGTAIIYSQLKTAIFNLFAPKNKNKRRNTTIMDLGFDDHDLWITATAMQHNLIVVSSDSDFIQIQQAQSFPLESWI
jgi:tRNA(fMet)-specific endonuclease VapC